MIEAAPPSGLSETDRAEAALVLVEIFARAGVVDSASVHLAHTLHRLRPAESDTVLLGAALALRAPRWGHVCFEPATIAETVVVDDGTEGAVDELPWPNPQTWAETLAASTLVTDASPEPVEDGAGFAPRQEPTENEPAERRPLVWDGTRLYLQRYWDHEDSVARRIVERLPAVGDRSVALDHRGLDQLFPPDVASQRQAAEAALTQALTVITGGPGTGKTHTIAGVVAALSDPAEWGDQDRPPQIALAAPTGKAAQRMTEAVQAERSGASSAARAGMATLEATTIHRLLGARRGSFQHDRSNPLPADVIIVDEMSMVSLPLMASLLDAARPEARLVLVGDPHQLASVEAGSVLRDLVDALPSAAVMPLDQVFRQAESSPIIPFADAVRSGDTKTVMALFADPDAPLELINPDDTRAMAHLNSELRAHAVSVLDAAHDPAEALRELGRLRVLTATRQGATGRAAWNARLESQLGHRTRGDRSGRWYPGRPVIVTENDYLNRLMNGDVGVATPGADGLEVAFARGVDVLRIAPTRLQAVDSVWAMTIHKSQGSEFDRVVVTLPPPPSPLLTRELLYTAVTRAREHVLVLASRESVAAAMQRSISRSSGLAQRLRSLGAIPAHQEAAAEPPAAEQLRLWD